MEKKDPSVFPLVKVEFETSIAYFSRVNLKKLREVCPLLDRTEDGLDLRDVNPAIFATLISLVSLSHDDLTQQMEQNPEAVECALDYAVQFDYDPVLNHLIRYYAEGKGKKRGSRISPRHGGEKFVQAVKIYTELTQLKPKLKPYFGLEDPFEESHSLTELSISHQGISELPKIPFSGHLTALDVQWNQLTVSSNQFKGFESLIYLNIACCQIRNLPPNVFKGLVKLKELYLDSNPLKRLRSQHARDLPSLTKLSVKNCEKMTVLPKAFVKHTTLATIITEGSGIRCEDDQDLPEITIEDLDGDRLKLFASSGPNRKKVLR